MKVLSGCHLIQRRASSMFKGKIIETVPASIHHHLFRSDVPSTSCPQELSLQLPKLKGDSIQDHFRAISEQQVSPYYNLLERAYAAFQTDIVVPKDSWKLEAGWTRYSFTDGSCTKVPYPLEDVFVFDVEVCVVEGQLPTLAVALSDKAWYGWCSERLVDRVPYPHHPTTDQLIPLGGHESTRLAIGHNVGYDRARSCEPYSKNKTFLRFLDTMSMSIPMFGMADHQRALHLADDTVIMEPTRRGQRRADGWRDAWNDRVCKNSLAAVYEHFYHPKRLDKGLQNFFVKQPMEDVRKLFQDLMLYCARDTLACAQVFCKLWPEFKKRFPDPITLIGFLNMGNAYLPVNRNWTQFYENNVKSCEDKKTAGVQAVARAAHQILDKCTYDDNWQPKGGFDAWLWPYDWTCKKKNAVYPEWFYKLFQKRISASLPLDQLTSADLVLKSALVPALFGMLYGPYPLYKSRKFGWGYIVPPKDGKGRNEKAEDMAGSTLATDSNFSFSVLADFMEKQIAENILEYGEIMLPDQPNELLGRLRFYQIPHPSGSGNVGDVFSKSFFEDIEQKVLRPTRFLQEFEVLLESLKTTRFWTNYSERFHDEVVIWQDVPDAADSRGQAAIAPAIIPAGTVSRRSVHKLWVTLTNSSDELMIGTGIKSLVQAPPGYRLVGADVDSQEQWLAGLFGDASACKAMVESKRHPGITPFSNMMLAGSKSDGTDLHSVVAKQLGIGRGQAKTLNYARLYGSGEKHAAKSLMQNGMKEMDANQTARQLFNLTKGASMSWRQLRCEIQPIFDEFLDAFGEQQYMTVDGKYYLPDYTSLYRSVTLDFEEWVVEKLKEEGGKVSDDVVTMLYQDYPSVVKLYCGGYESATFNFLEQQAGRSGLRTPVLGCQLVDSLTLPEGTPDLADFAAKYKRSVMNWLVQSSAVDFLHLLLVCMEWLCSEYDISARFVISIHDEVRYLCPEEEAPRVGLALMLSNMYVRSYISDRVGVSQLPMSVAFFSQVDCDTVLRKEVDTPCSHPDGTKVPDGISWTMEDLLKITDGKLEKLSL